MRYFFVDYENVRKDGLYGVENLHSSDRVRIYYSEAAETLTFDLHRKINRSAAEFNYIKVLDRIKNALDCKILFDVRDYMEKEPEAEYYIVANDKDYDDIVQEFRKKGMTIDKVAGIFEQCKSQAETKAKITKKKKSKAEEKLQEAVGFVRKRKVKTVEAEMHKTAVLPKEQPKEQPKKRQEEKLQNREQVIRSYFGRNLKDYGDKKEEIIDVILNAQSRQQLNNSLQKYCSNASVKDILKRIKPLIKDLPGE